MNVKRLDLVTCGLDPGSGRPRVIISTDSLDAMNDTIRQAGLQIRPPIPMMLNHDYRSLPVGRIPDLASVHRGDHRTECSFDFFEHDAEIDRVKNLYAQGAFGASVGFRILESKPNAHGGLDILRSELHEVSLTAMPANRDCQVVVRSLFGARRLDDAVVLDLDDEEIDLDARDVIAAVRSVIPALVAGEVAQHYGRRDVLDVDDDFDPLGNPADRAMLVDAIKVAVPLLLRTEIDRLRGRIIDE